MYDRILVSTDGSATAERGVNEAIALAAQLRSRLVLLHVVDDFALVLQWAPASTYEDALQHLRNLGRAILDKAAQKAAAHDIPCDLRLVDARQQTIAQAIVEEAWNHDCGLIVMGTHGRRGLKRLSMGSDAELVLRTSHIPVLLVRSEDDAQAERATRP